MPIPIKDFSLKPEKKANVNSLLKKHFGIDWKSLPHLQFFKDIMESDSNFSLTNESHSSLCEFNEE